MVRGVTARDTGRSRGHDGRRLTIGRRTLKPWRWPIPAASASGGRAGTQVFPSSELRACGCQCRPHHRAPTGGGSQRQLTPAPSLVAQLPGPAQNKSTNHPSLKGDLAHRPKVRLLRPRGRKDGRSRGGLGGGQSTRGLRQRGPRPVTDPKTNPAV